MCFLDFSAPEVELKNKKVIQILYSKDAQIAGLDKQVSELSARLQAAQAERELARSGECDNTYQGLSKRR